MRISRLPPAPTRSLTTQRPCTCKCSSSTQVVQPATASQLLDLASGPAVLDKLDTLILDCDGVLWRGDTPIPNAVKALQIIREKGKRLLFVTNNSSKSRAQYVAKFKSLGFEVNAKEIVSSSYTAAAYLTSIDFGQHGERVLLFGTKGMGDELSAAGIKYIDAQELQLPMLDNVDSMLRVQLDDRIGAVVMGWDPTFNYSKLAYASACLRELPGCLFVATNLDHADYIGNGRMMPGTGTLVSALQVASGVRPVNAGKGGIWLFPYLLQQYNLEPNCTAIIGDRLDTDIALGREGGLTTILPLTGVSALEDAMTAQHEERPDFVMDSIATLAGYSI